MELTENARKIFDLRYSRKDEHGNPTETPEQAVRRVADNVASVTALYEQSDHGGLTVFEPESFPYRTAKRQFDFLHLGVHGDLDGSGWQSFKEMVGKGWPKAEAQAKRYQEMIEARDFFPNSPTWTGAGTQLGQLAACFVLPVDDDLVEGPDSIYSTMRNAIAIQQTGGGNGFSFGRLRPRDALVKRSMGKASGPVGFARSYNAAFKEMAQGGTRRGANMLVLPVHHPDIRQFITSKIVEGELDQFNISVAITDEFMEAVDKDGDFDLRHGGVVYETIKARDLWNEIVHNAHIIGDPGNLFIDEANRHNPVPRRYTLEATNPCGEQWLGPYENCCLGSINLANFVVGGSFDWERFRETVVLATQFLDDVVDANQYVSAVPQLEQAAQGGRRIGLGLMGLADAMVQLVVRYGDDDGIAFASQVTEFARYHCMMASIERARDRGPFPWIRGSIYDPDDLGIQGAGAVMQNLGEPTYSLWEPPYPLDGGLQEHDFGRPSLDWELVLNGLMEHGIRNCCQFTFAPTGTISNVAGCEGSGCEPMFALTYTRKVMQDGEDIELTYASPLFREALQQYGYAEKDIEVIVERVQRAGGSCQSLTDLPADIRHSFVVAADVSAEGHIRTQAALQRFVDNSISKTINMPNEATVEDVAAAYRLAYDLGCKGITIYRQGSRELEVLSTGSKTEATGDGEILLGDVMPMPVPDYAETSGLPTKTYKVKTAFGNLQVYVTERAEEPGRPFDCRISLGKAGSDKAADVEAFSRLLSLLLRARVPIPTIVDQIEGIGGQTQHGFGERRVRSVADGIGKLLRRVYMEATFTEMPTLTLTESVQIDTSSTCPECGIASLVMESGCRHCDPRLGGCGNYSGCD